MASSITEVGNPQQGGKKGKDKNKDLAFLVDDKLTEVNNSIITLTGRVDEMEKRIEELESEGDLEELRRDASGGELRCGRCQQRSSSPSSIKGRTSGGTQGL